MPDQKPSPGLSLQSASKQVGELPMPKLLRTATRSGSAEIDPLLAGLRVEESYTLGTATRGEAQAETVRIEGTRVLALEAEDGTTLFIRADKLNEDVLRLQPATVVNGGGNVELAGFRDPEAASRGFVDILWKAVSVLRLPDDGLASEAMDLARDWASAQVKDALGEKLQEKVWDTASFLGAKALIWKIESRLAGRSGLYCWQNQNITADDRCLLGDPRLDKGKAGQPMLLLIHGTASYTVGSFADLQADKATWKALQARFPGGIFGYEHRSFSQSPQENAVELLQHLPEGARLSLVTHSRGGLVGDLLCLGQVDDAAIDAYHIEPTGNADQDGLEREAAAERQRLRQIIQLIGERRISVERYVRVACPARGTRFLSDNLEVALSDFLNLLQWGGGALVGVAAAALGGPAAGKRFGNAASSAIGVLKRLVLEIAGRRIDPQMIPGIAAMRTDSPLAVFLAHPGSRRRDGIAMAVIAGDTEFSGLGLNKLGRRLANLFCDWRLFDDHDNDLVVDTDSMYAGLGLQKGTSYLYDQGESISHFRYFCNPLTRDALRGWLVDEPTRLPQFQALSDGSKRPWKDAEARRAERGAVSGERPVVILLPDFMASHLALDKTRDETLDETLDETRDATRSDIERIWFHFGHLAQGRALDRLADIANKSILAEALWERFYADLADYLATSHTVIGCPYDWRLPIEVAAEALATVIKQALDDHPGQPIRLLAHGTGGLVARVLMQPNAEDNCWQQVVKSGGRLLMLGTPNKGTHLMVHTLLGKTASLRGLQKLDGRHTLQQLVDIVASFPGALALLPRPADTGSGPCIAHEAYYSPATWADLKARNLDRWYGNQMAAVPSAEILSSAEKFWKDTLPDNPVANPERVIQIFGQGEKTPCGVARTDDGRLQLFFTSEGDGSVTWESSRLKGLPEDERCWYLPVEHADLTSKAEYFPAIVELLNTGTTSKLGCLPRSRGAVARPFPLAAPPPVIPSEDELARAFLASGPRRSVRPRKATLAVSVLAGDLRFIDQPLICGHFIGDPIAAAEAELDRELEGRLSERERLGVYAGEIGSSAIVLAPHSVAQASRGSRPGAVIVGLGDFNGQLGTRQVSETVRAAVLRLLLLLRDIGDHRADAPVQLYSLLLGCNSSTQISIDDSVAAVTCGVLEANRQFAEALAKSYDRGVAVSSLTFIDLYRDVAITAAHAVADLQKTLKDQLRRLDARLEVAHSLQIGKGVRERLSAESGAGYWSRLIVTDADAPEVDCPAECYEERCRSPIPPEVRRRLSARSNPHEQSDSGETDAAASEAPRPKAPYYPERLKYVFPRSARAENLVQQRQPGLIEAIISKQRFTNTHNPRLGQTLFQLMVPVDYKAAARERSRLLLILDSYTASLPWELLQPDQEPLAISIPMVRQLITSRFRGAVPMAGSNSACIIVAPSTQGYDRRFGGKLEALADLPGAIEEGEAVRNILREARWDQIVCSAEGREAIDVLADLYQQPYRLLTICGHGIFEARALDGRSYSGVVLSDGLLITAVEIGLMEVVPEVVFLSCCHLGSMSHATAQPNRLAYSLARELIDIGVRCVLAAGWAVNDDAAKTFAIRFFKELTDGEAYGDAVFAARKETQMSHPATNTWGAYQAYGDPSYRLVAPNTGHVQRATERYVAVEELLDSLENRRVSYARRRSGDPGQNPDFAEEAAWVRKELARCLPEWEQRPDVQQPLGALYAELGDDGFDPAMDAYLAALQQEDSTGRVACRLIEQIANLEARRGEKLVNQSRHQDGLLLLKSAVARLQALDEAVRSSSNTMMENPERAALLGSALKRQAAALAQTTDNPQWEDITSVLAFAADTYFKAGKGDATQPYHTLNALSLAALAGALPTNITDGPELARRCGEEASRRFRSSKDFWDAAGGPDAAVAVWLLDRKSSDEGDHLRNAYRQLKKEIPHTPREWDSVSKQLRLLALFLKLRNGEGDPERAATLTGLTDCE